MRLATDLILAGSRVAFARQCGIEPDEWQAELLRSQARRILLNCSRQSGKSTIAALIALHTALYTLGSMTVILAPGMRQSTELHRKVLSFYRQLGKPVAPESENQLSLELEGGSRIVCLPGSEATIRGISGVDLLVVEEAARVPEDLYFSVLPMLATRPNARQVMMSTPFGDRGIFYNAWRERQQWRYFEIPATMCPRISTEFLADQKRVIGPFWYDQEFCCVFGQAQGAAFRAEDIERMKHPDVEIWDMGPRLGQGNTAQSPSVAPTRPDYYDGDGKIARLQAELEALRAQQWDLSRK